MKELSLSKAIFKRDCRAISNLISQRLRDESLIGQIVIWSSNEPSWIFGLQPRPPAEKTLVVPEEWKKGQPDLEKAERAEFRRRNFSDAISLYKQIFHRAKDNQVKAWILSRIARCEVKQKKFKQALINYHLIIADFPDLLTESGRPMELVSSLEILDVLRSDEDYNGFFQESLKTYNQLEKNVWSLDGDQLKLYITILKNMIDEVMAENSSNDIPDEYVSAVDDLQKLMDKKFEVWRIAEAVRRNILPSIRERLENLNSDNLPVQKKAFGFEEIDVLVLLVPLDRNDSGHESEFLGSLLRISDLREAIDSLVKKKCPPGVSILLRSILSDNIIFGDTGATLGSPVITDFFPENFPPWRLELHQSGSGESGFLLHENIFFWTILALLFILFFGSALIIRTIIHEVNLLNLKSEFIASVSHEFKTPLTSMGAIIERLLDDEVKDPDKAQEYYRILSHDSERLRRLVKNVLDFTKIEEGRREYKRKSIDIVGLVRHEVDNFENENKSEGFKVRIEVGDNIPTVFADEDAMSQALHNILDNAAKFSGQEKEISIKIVRKENSVEITVRDRGIGIPANEQKKNLIMGIFLLAGVSLLFSSLMQQETAKELFERALYFEDTKGDLEKAIEVYKRVVKEFPDERATAAQAQLHLGYCFEKLGLKEAQKAYQNVIDKYPEQIEAVKTAQKKLSLLLRIEDVVEKRSKEFQARQVWTGREVDGSGKISFDGKYLSFVDWSTGNLAIREMASGEKTLLTQKGSWKTDAIEFAMDSVWSRDGKHLLYISIRGPRKRQPVLCIYSLESGSVREFHFKDEFVYFAYPHWCPDGRHILLGAEHVQSGKGLYKVDAQTGEVTLLIQAKESESMGSFWSPVMAHDGKFLFYDYENSAYEYYRVMVRDLETGKETELLRHPPHDNNQLALSPDGEQLALVLREEKDMRMLKVMPTKGGEPVILYQVDFKRNWVQPVDWSPDGRYIYFSKPTPEGWELWRVPVQRGEAENLELKMFRFIHLNIHPDGQRIIFASYVGDKMLPEIWVLENFLPKLMEKK